VKDDTAMPALIPDAPLASVIIGIIVVFIGNAFI
jgi:hypothetical protein